MANRIIDAHSHMGIENKKIIVTNLLIEKTPTLEGYKNLISGTEIKEVLVTPPPTPVIIESSTNTISYEYLWQYVGGKPKYYKKIVNGDKESLFEIVDNPYKKVNDLMYMYYVNNSTPELTLHPVPLINPIFDTVDEVDKYIQLGVKCFKIHGVSIGLDDLKLVNLNILKRLSEVDIPLAIHTDFFSNPVSPIQKIYNANNSMNWIKLLELYKVRSYLIHGCRNSSEAAKYVNSNKNYIVGISPDILLGKEPERLMENEGNYLQSIFSKFEINSLVFDIDYCWNILERDNFSIQDTNFCERIFEYLDTEEKRKKVLSKNAKEFFKI